MQKAIIICNAGMSSSFMAKKTTEFLQSKGKDVEVTATTIVESDEKVKSGDYDLYLVSPQARMIYDRIEKLGKENGVKVAQIPFDAYSPVEPSIKKLAKLILKTLAE